MLFNLLSYLSDKLLTEGHTVAGLDELYIWLSNPHRGPRGWGNPRAAWT